jgi:sugar O-acyltransferase (sialic acid O-acetyltransferase NeuD family)
MKTETLIIGKGDDIITMILDNLSSENNNNDIIIYNNLDLPIDSTFLHPEFDITLLNKLEISDYSKWILGIYKPNLKKKIIENFGIYCHSNFVNCIHKGLDISKTSKLGIGCLINSKVSIAAHTTIKNYVSINRNTSIGHHTIIEDYVSINPGCNIAGHCHIGEGSTIGMGSQILNGVKIGKNTVIGAGSIVTRDIPDNVIAWGSPCKIKNTNE